MRTDNAKDPRAHRDPHLTDGNTNLGADQNPSQECQKHHKADVPHICKTPDVVKSERRSQTSEKRAKSKACWETHKTSPR